MLTRMYWHEKAQPRDRLGRDHYAVVGSPVTFVDTPNYNLGTSYQGIWMQMPYDAWQSLGGPVDILVEISPDSRPASMFRAPVEGE